MARTFTTIESLEQYLKSTIVNSLEGEVAKKVKQVESKNVTETVYNAYNPIKYKQRKNRGGLSDVRNMTSRVDKQDMVLTVENDTEVNPLHHNDFPNYSDDDDSLFRNAYPSSYGLAEIIENGTSGGLLPAYNPPRPFTQNTIEDLSQNRQHITAMKKGLKSQGVTAK